MKGIVREKTVGIGKDGKKTWLPVNCEISFTCPSEFLTSDVRYKKQEIKDVKSKHLLATDAETLEDTILALELQQTIQEHDKVVIVEESTPFEEELGLFYFLFPGEDPDIVNEKPEREIFPLLAENLALESGVSVYILRRDNYKWMIAFEEEEGKTKVLEEFSDIYEALKYFAEI